MRRCWIIIRTSSNRERQSRRRYSALKGVKTGFFPKLQLSGNYSYQIEDVEFMQGVDLKHNNYSAEAALSQNVYAGSMVRKQQEAAKLQKAIARLGKS